MTRWYVCDMDEGVLRVAETRAAAVEWWKTYTDSNAVLSRHTYAPGYYSYTVGRRGDDEWSEIAIVREDRLPHYGLDFPAAGLDALPVAYPYPDRPYEPAEDGGTPGGAL